MERYKVKKIKVKHAQACHEISPYEKGINDKIDYLKEEKRGLFALSIFFGTASLFSLSTIVLIKDNSVRQIGIDIILSALSGGISYLSAHDAKEKNKKILLLKKEKSKF